LEGFKRDLSPPWKKGEEPEWLKESYELDKNRLPCNPLHTIRPDLGNYYRRRRSKTKIKVQNYLMTELKYTNEKRNWTKALPYVLKTLRIRIPRRKRPAKQDPVVPRHVKNQLNWHFSGPDIVNHYREPENPPPKDFKRIEVTTPHWKPPLRHVPPGYTLFTPGLTLFPKESPENIIKSSEEDTAESQTSSNDSVMEKK